MGAMNEMTSLDVCACLRRACRAAGSQQAWAAANGVSSAYVSDVLNARREPGEAILRALGLRKIVRYVKARNSRAASQEAA
jgi:DNA-binding transcriptional regulator YdaS (Cro superfamily)